MYGKGLGQQKKTGTRRAAVFLKSVLGQGLLNALFGKARACRSALAGLELGIAKTFHTAIENGVASLPGVVSRKKQMIPLLINALKQEQE